MFQRKKPETAKPDNDPAGNEGMDDISSPPLKPFSRKGSHAPLKPPSPTSFHPETPRRSIPDIPGVPSRRIERPMSADAESRRLVIGRDICLNGEITACDKLVVEGRAEVVLTDAGAIEVAPGGFFKGTATVDEADISGRFEGELIARDRLIVRSGGRISGAIRYGRIVIESGGEISGDMQTLDGFETDGGADTGDAPEAGAAEATKRKRGGSKSPAGKK